MKPATHGQFSRSRKFNTRRRVPRKTDNVNPEHVAAFDAMCAARPLKPPPHDFGPRRSHAAIVAARREKPGIA